jgi:hypothetical protein
MSNRLLAGLAALALTVPAAAASAKTRVVPAQYPSIQQAIEEAVLGDTVLVQDGTYHEGIVISQAQRGIVLRSENGSLRTILEGTAASRIVTFDEVDTLTEISGFTLRGGDPQFDGGAIYAYRSRILVANCEFAGNETQGDGGAVALYDSWALLWKNTISANVARQGGGVFSNGSSVTLADNTLRNNSARQDGGGALFIGGDVTMTGNSFIGNQAGEDGGGVAFLAEEGTLRSNSFVRNVARNGGGFICQGGAQPDLNSDRFSDNQPSDVIDCASRPIQN